MTLPEPAGHYSTHVVANGFLFTAGQLATGNGAVPEGARAQTLACLAKIEAILNSEGLDRTAVVKTLGFLSHGDDWAEVNRAYEEFFGDHRPARSLIPVGPLPHGCVVEIEAIAALL